MVKANFRLMIIISNLYLLILQIERLILQIARHPGYISGGEFFIITRSLILRVSSKLFIT